MSIEIDSRCVAAYHPALPVIHTISQHNNVAAYQTVKQTYRFICLHFIQVVSGGISAKHTLVPVISHQEGKVSQLSQPTIEQRNYLLDRVAVAAINVELKN
ncbi:hypothetical protein EON65_50460 [archaeon]|nr:MAG: hypothetical protein EON65_50460 [archaeon]